MLQSSGFEDVWLFPDSVNFKLFIPVLRTRLETRTQHNRERYVHYYTCLENLKQFLSSQLI